MHKFPRSLAMVSVLAPAGVNALGLGDITLHSALNQDLDAEIPLIVSKSESVSDIQVSLASPEAFANAGIERNFSLSNIRFKPVVRPDGSTAIRVTSKGVVREPLLNFLVEVNWPMGRMYREFTVLLDPPVTLGMPTEVLPAAPVVSRNQVFTEPAASTSNLSYGQDKTTSSYPQQGIRYTSSEVGPTRRNDSLWNVAKRVQVDGSASHEQIMMALFDHNPHAFYKNNVNALKAGHVLRVPPYEAIVRRTQKKASDEFYRQYAEWQGGIKAKSKRVANAAATLEDKNLESRGHLTLDSQTDDVQVSGAGGVNTAAGSKAALAMEIADTISQENEELRARIEILEGQLAKIQRMLTLQNGSLATVQADTLKETEVESTDVVDQAGALGGEIEATSAEVLEPVDKVKPLPQGVEEAAVVSSEQPVEAVVEQPPVAAPVQETKKAKLVQPPMAEPEEGLLTTILADPTYLAAGGTGVALLGLLTWMLLRRRRQELNDAMESILAVPEESNEIVGQVQGDESDNTAAQDIGTVAESSFLSEFSPSDFDVLDSDDDEVDPISEADVYLAYGRYQQAEDLIRQAIEKDPARDVCKLKLLEIFFANEDPSAFESYAAELKNDGKDSNTEFWNKVAEMGVEICPTSRLFDGGTLGSQGSIAEELDALSEGNEGVLSEIEDQPADFEPAVADRTVLDESRALEFEAPSPEVTHDSNEIELDLADIEPMAGIDDLSIEGSSDDAIEFTLADGDDKEESIDDIALQFDGEIPNNDSEPPAVEFDAASMDLNAATVAVDKVAEAGEGSGDLTLEGVGEEVEERVELSNGDRADDTLANLDEVETKLDLAKAYIDMEDEQAARDMLREVIGKGNSTQKNEAEDLIEKLASNG